MTIILTPQLAADLMVTALEGGSDYWIGAVRPIYPNHQAYSEPENYGPGMIERQVITDENEPAPYPINWQNLTHALNLMHDHHTHHYADVVTENYDAYTADVFLQLTVFRDVIYG